MADRNNSEVAIHAHEVAKRFNGEFAVRNLELDVPKGTIFGFIGPSGSGKTTTIRLLTGIIKPTTGDIRVLGQNPFRFSPGLRERIGYMPQLSVLYPNLSVWENINFAASIYGLGLFRGRRLNQLLEFVELKQHKHKLTRSLSGGMQRRLSLASTLVQDPDLLFLDEPTAGVDPVLRVKFWDYFRELKNRGRTLFITTQYVAEMAYCDWVAVMSQGRLVRVDTPENLRRYALGGEIVALRTAEVVSDSQIRQLNDLSFMREPLTVLSPNHVHLKVTELSSAVPALLDWCKAQNLTVESLEPYQPPFDDIFVELVRERAVDA